MADDTPRDDWGFSAVDHAELQGLMTKHEAHVPSVLLDLMQHGGVGVTPDDVLSVPMGTVITGTDGQSRGFPPGGFWWALLDQLRALDDDIEKGGA